MASGSEMEVVVVAQVAQYLKGMQDTNAANLAVAKSLEQMMGGFKALPAATKPAEAAVGGLEKAFKDFKRSEVQEGRMVGFYVREMIGFTGASAGVQAGLGGIIQGMIGLASAAGPVMAIWAGFELVKGTFELITESTKKAAEEMKKFTAEAKAAVEAGTKSAIGLAGRERNKFTDARGGDSELDGARKEALAAAKALQAFETQMGVRGKVPSADLTGIITSEQLATWLELTKKVKDASAALRDYRSLKEANAQDARNKAALPEFGPGDAIGGVAFEDRTKNLAKSAKDKLDVAQNRGLLDAIVGINESEGYALSKTIEQTIVEAAKNAQIGAKSRLDKAQAEGLWNSMVGVSESEGYDLSKTYDAETLKAAHNATKALNNEATKSSEIFATLGNSIGSAFGSLGEMIGGAAGVFMKAVGQMIQQAIQLAISMSMAGTAWTTPLGMLAFGATALAGILSIVASVPSFAVGTAYVPKTGLAMIHQGEAIIPAAENARGGRGGNISITVNAVDGPSVYRTLTDNRGHVARALREMARDGVS